MSDLNQGDIYGRYHKEYFDRNQHQIIVTKTITQEQEARDGLEFYELLLETHIQSLRVTHADAKAIFGNVRFPGNRQRWYKEQMGDGRLLEPGIMPTRVNLGWEVRARWEIDMVTDLALFREWFQTVVLTTHWFYPPPPVGERTQPPQGWPFSD